MQLKLISVFIVALAIPVVLIGCRKKNTQTTQPTITETFPAPSETFESITAETYTETEKQTETLKATTSEDVKMAANEYAAYIQMQQDKISILMRQASSCTTIDEYKAITDHIIEIAEEVKDYPTPDDSRELKEMTEDAIDEIISIVKDSCKKAEAVLPEGE